MKNTIGFISGIGLIIFGMYLISLGAKLFGGEGGIWLLIYGFLALICGAYMVFNFKKEDNIEQIKEEKK